MAQGTGSGNGANLSALQQFMVGQGASSTLTPAQALAAYQALAPERQLLFANQVLIGEIRKAGRAASALAGAERDAAYQPAYAALDVVFPQVGTPGNLSMGSSQIHTLQDSAIDIMAPRGSGRRRHPRCRTEPEGGQQPRHRHRRGRRHLGRGG